MVSEAYVPTEKASAYIRKLCKHFSHKATTEFTEARGNVTFEFGTCEMQAEPDMLVLRVESDDATLIPRLEAVVGRHLEGFAQGEELRIEWKQPAPEAAETSS